MRILWKIKKIYYNINLRTKLIISYLLLIIFPVVILSTFSYANIRRTAMAQSGKAYLTTLKQAEKNITYILQTGMNVADIIRSNHEIQRIMRIMNDRPLSTIETIDYFTYLNKTVIDVQNTGYITSVSYFISGKPAFLNTNYNFLHIDILKEIPALKPLINGDIHRTWNLASELGNLKMTSENTIAYFCEIRDLSAINTVIGYIMVEMDASFIWSILDDIDLPQGAECIVRKNGTILNKGSMYPQNKSIAKAFFNFESEYQEGISPFSTGKEHCYAVTCNIEKLGWNVSLLITEKALGINSKWIGSFMLVLSVLLSGVAIITAIFISGSITKRLKKLMVLFKKAESGNFEVDTQIKGNDEYAHLQRCFNQMSIQINELIEEVYKTKISRQEVEMKLLYAQINPHFLYNTLDIIQWNARRINAVDIIEVTELLTKYLRLSLNNGKESILVSEELEQIEKYMGIINYRYRGSIRFYIQLQNDISNISIIKMVLQPLVENAIIHGIKCKKEKTGTIVVKVYKENNYIYFNVIDDGVGISRQRLQDILESESTGYGLRNVHQRIQVHYGEDCGLSFFSRPGIGTCIVVKLKLKR